MTSAKKRFRRILWGIVISLFIIVAFFGIRIYEFVFTPNINQQANGPLYIYIPTGAGISDLMEILDSRKLLIDEKSFLFTAKQLKYDQNIKPGRYLLKKGMNNKELITLLKSGRQSPLNLIFNNIRSKEQLAERIGEQIEASPKSILNLMNDGDYVNEYGFTPDNILCLFIPDTYEMYWNTSADQFIKRMHKEYTRFWNTTRMNKSRDAGMSQVEVSVLASIVQMETNRNDEKPVIAGVYINRLKKDWKLEADPTLVYALGDFSIKRVLSVYKEIESPYNTYKYKGLPPGPICLPTRNSIDAVLNYSKHSYMYFCAKEDFSGYHNFASNYLQHLINARKFQRALNKRGIKS